MSGSDKAAEPAHPVLIVPTTTDSPCDLKPDPRPGNGKAHQHEKGGKAKRKRRRRSLARHRPGSQPGILFTDPDAPKPVITIFAYNQQEFIERQIDDLDQIPHYLDQWKVSWINVNGLGDAQAIKKFGELFGLHRLALEDVLNLHQRPKVDTYPNYLYIVARTINTIDPLDTDQVSIFLGHQFVLSFQEKSYDCYELIRERLREAKGYIRKEGPGYLTYAIIDAVIDGFFPALENFSDKMESIEDRVLTDPAPDLLTAVHEIRRNLIILRRSIWPLREAVNSMIRDANPLFSPETLVYLRDCYDHSVQIIDLTESYREVASDLMGVYLSSLGQKTNEIMKVLTLLATIFMPLTFIVGIYGMNFNPESSPYNMPELNWRFGYLFTLGLMAILTIGMIMYFRHRGWIGSAAGKFENSHPAHSEKN